MYLLVEARPPARYISLLTTRSTTTLRRPRWSLCWQTCEVPPTATWTRSATRRRDSSLPRLPAPPRCSSRGCGSSRWRRCRAPSSCGRPPSRAPARRRRRTSRETPHDWCPEPPLPLACRGRSVIRRLHGQGGRRHGERRRRHGERWRRHGQGRRCARDGDVTARDGDVTDRDGDVTASERRRRHDESTATSRSGTATSRRARDGDVTARDGDVTARDGDVTDRECDVKVRDGDDTAKDLKARYGDIAERCWRHKEKRRRYR